MTCRSFAPAALAILAMSCSSQPLRAVVDVVPESVSYELQVRATECFVEPEFDAAELGEVARRGGPAAQDSAPSPWTTLGPEPEGPVLGARARLVAFPAQGFQQGPLDPDDGPMDLGFPLIVDFGAGEAPYDDGVPTIHGVELTRSGFSDSLLQASWGQPWSATSMVHGTVAMSRFQDLGIMDGLSDMRFAWFVVGWKTAL